jgi:membrane dipeptidase
VIGAWPSATNASFAEFVENTKRLADVVGVEHVGLGTDMDGNLRPVLSSYRQFPEWTAALATQGFTAREVAQMAGENMARMIGQVIG